MINATKGANLLTHIFKFITSKWGKWITLTTWMTGSIILIMAAPVDKPAKRECVKFISKSLKTKKIRECG